VNDVVGVGVGVEELLLLLTNLEGVNKLLLLLPPGTAPAAFVGDGVGVVCCSSCCRFANGDDGAAADGDGGNGDTCRRKGELRGEP
jgi:hypothetical protein